jgi:anti-sigma28 factor (negative regulator of flagellin synthesis)
MKISDSSGRPVSGVGATTADERTGEQRSQRASGGTAADHDRVQLSNLSAHIAAAQGNSSSHLAKLDRLDAAVSAGHYHVEAGIVSAAVIQQSLQFASGT